MKRIYSIFFLAVLVFSCERPILEFQSQNFVKFFGSGYESGGNDVIQLADGSYVFTGYDKVNTTDYQLFIAKADENGNELWSAAYGLPGVREEAKVIKKVADGFLIAGSSRVSLTSTTTLTHAFIMKIGESGDSIWYNEFGDPTLDIHVNDFVVGNEFIYVAGYSFSQGNSMSSNYLAKLELLTGKLDWKRAHGVANSNSFFSKVFLQGQEPLVVGYNGDEKKTAIVEFNTSGIGTPVFMETEGETVSDAVFIDNNLYILVNNEESSAYTKLYKVTTGADEIWKTESISSISGKTFTKTDDGRVFVFGESIEGGSSLINTIEVDSDGNADYSATSFKTIQGFIEKVKSTSDRGLILIGSSNATNDTKLQLIKTDKDLFLLRP